MQAWDEDRASIRYFLYTLIIVTYAVFVMVVSKQRPKLNIENTFEMSTGADYYGLLLLSPEICIQCHKILIYIYFIS